MISRRGLPIHRLSLAVQRGATSSATCDTSTAATDFPLPPLSIYVQSGVNADAISRDDYLNAPGETYSVKLTAAGEYGYYC